MIFKIKKDSETYNKMLEFQEKRISINQKRADFAKKIFNENNIELNDSEKASICVIGSHFIGFVFPDRKKTLNNFRYDAKQQCLVPDARTKEGKELKKEIEELRDPSDTDVHFILFGNLIIKGLTLYTPAIEFPNEKEDSLLVCTLPVYEDYIPKDSEEISTEEFHLLMAKKNS